MRNLRFGTARPTPRPSFAGAAVDEGAVGWYHICVLSGRGVTLNRGDDSPGTDSGRQATSCEPTSVSTLG